MERYELKNVNYGTEHDEVEMCLDPEGEWVRYEEWMEDDDESAMCEANSNAVLGDERAKYDEIIYDLVFAYENKDEGCPHEFERDALINAYNILTQKHHVKFVNKAIEKISTFFA